MVHKSVYKATQSCFPVSGPTSHLKMTRTPGIFFFFFFRKPSGKKMVYKQQNASWRVRSGGKTMPKYRSLDGESTECRLCKHWLHPKY